MLICFAPIGVFLLWKNNLYNNILRLAISGIFLALFVIAGIDELSNPTSGYRINNNSQSLVSISSSNTLEPKVENTDVSIINNKSRVLNWKTNEKSNK